MTKKMNTKMSKLALYALLSVGVVPATNGDPTDSPIKNLLWKSDVALLNELGTLEKCNEAYKDVKNELSKVEDSLENAPKDEISKLLSERGGLLSLAERVNFLCALWVWLTETGVKLQKSDMERILSEGVSREDDLDSLEKLQFLRSASWGKGLASTETKEKLQRLSYMYEKVI